MAEEKKAKMGRPPVSFSERLQIRLVELATKGATDEQLALAANVSIPTLKAYKARHPDFLAALKNAKDIADDLVEASLYLKATGYTHRSIKFFCYEGAIVSEEYDEHFAPDTTAMIFWLKNRRPQQWRDVHKLEHTGKDGGPIRQGVISLEEARHALGPGDYATQPAPLPVVKDL